MNRSLQRSVRAALVLGGLGVAVFAAPASALTIVATYDSSVTSQANAAAIESAFNTVATNYQNQFSNPVTVNVTVSWGSVDSFALPSNAVGASVDPLYGYYTYAQVKAALAAAALANPTDTTLATAVSHMPLTTPSGVSQYVVASADAKALGLIAGNDPDPDGFIGFAGSTSNYSFNSTGAIAAGTYDFQGVAAHELAEVLGDISGLSGVTPTYRTPFDLFRYKSAGNLGFVYNTGAYFSIDGGVTHLKNFNYDKTGGDRGDWNTSATDNDARDAFIATGRRYVVNAVDLAALDVLGWGGSNIGDTMIKTKPASVAFTAAVAAPEPGTWSLLIAGFGLAGATLRRRRAAVA